MFGIKVLISVLLIVGVFNLDYQERSIYLGQDDNVCKFGQQSDKIKITINLDGSQKKNFETYGFTLCNQWYATDAERIIPTDYWPYISRDRQDYIQFQEETKRTFSGARLIFIVQKTTVINPVTLNGLSYTCNIIGDGTTQHFGTDSFERKPAELNLKCDKIVNSKENLQKQ